MIDHEEAAFRLYYASWLCTHPEVTFEEVKATLIAALSTAEAQGYAAGMAEGRKIATPEQPQVAK